MKKKVFLIFSLLIILVFLILSLLSKNSKLTNLNSEQTNLNTPASSTNESNQAKQTLSGPAAVSGWLKCLPSKINNLECVIGVEDINGKNYGLVDPLEQQLDQTNLPSGARYNAVGTFIATQNFLINYNIEGTIRLDQ